MQNFVDLRAKFSIDGNFLCEILRGFFAKFRITDFFLRNFLIVKFWEKKNFVKYNLSELRNLSQNSQNLPKKYNGKNANYFLKCREKKYFLCVRVNPIDRYTQIDR